MWVVWLILGLIVYLAIGNFLCGLFTSNNDFDFAVLCIWLWPIVTFLYLSIEFIEIVRKKDINPFGVFIRLGRLLRKKIKAGGTKGK